MSFFSKLVWVLDVALALNQLGNCSAVEFVEQARAQGLKPVLHIGCAMVLEVFPQRMPQDLSAVLAESPKALQAARACVATLLAGGAGTGHGPEIWSFYLQTEGPKSRRWRRRLQFFIPTVEDYRWTSNRRIPRSLAGLARPFRMLAKYGFRRAWRASFPRSV